MERSKETFSSLEHPHRWMLANRNRILGRIQEGERKAKLLRKEYSTKINPKSYAQLRWLEQWDTDSVFNENVDLANSQAALSIPLIDVPITPSLHIALSLSYNSGDTNTNGLFGNGWNVHNIGQDYILVDHQQSSFSHNHEYRISLDGNTFNLIPSKDSTNKYSLDEDPDVQVTFDRANSRWIVETPNLKTVYGNPLNDTVGKAIHLSLKWPYWRGSATSEAGLISEEIAWYVVSREEKFGKKQKLLYTYKIETKQTTANKSYTSVLIPDTIYDSEENTKLTLIYGEKDSGEYVDMEYMNSDKRIQFPVYLTSKYYVIGYHLETNGYQQQLQFNYDVDTLGTRTLMEVFQIFNENGGRAGEQECIFKFSYHEHQTRVKLLESLEVPSYSSSVHYKYTSLQLPLMKFGRSDLDMFKFPATDNVQIKQGEKYGVMAYNLGTGGTYVQIMNRQLTKRTDFLLNTGNTSVQVIEEDPKKIINFGVVLYKYLLAVVEETSEEKRIHLFYKKDDDTDWPRVPTKTIRYGKYAIIRYTDKFIVVSPEQSGFTGKLLLYEPIENEENDKANDDGYKEFTLQTACLTCKITRLVAQDGVILAYNGQALYGWKMNIGRTNWERTLIHEVASREKEMFEQFELKQDIADSIRGQLNTTGLHVADNMILLPVVDWTGGENAYITTAAHLILVDDNLNKMVNERHVVYQEKVTEVELMRDDLLEDGTNMFFRYQWKENKFHAFLHNIKGKTVEEGCKDAPDEAECVKEILKQYNESPSFIENAKGMVLFEWESMTTFQLDNKGAKSRNHTFELTGTSWRKNLSSTVGSIKLGNNFRINTAENENKTETDYTLFRQNPANGGTDGGQISNWKMIGGKSAMAVGYPSYVCMQTDLNGGLNLLPLRERGQSLEPIAVGEAGEMVLDISNQEILLTLQSFTDPQQPIFDKQITVRRINSLIESAPLWVLSSSEVRHMDQSRMRAYHNEYRFDASQRTQINTVCVTPSGNKQLSGYYQEITVIPVEDPETATKTQNWYDIHNNLVDTKDVQQSIDEQQEVDEEDAENTKKWHKIWDLSHELEITDTSPYNVTDQAVGYFGFENYENNTIPVTFPAESLIRDATPFTGSNMIRLIEQQSMSFKVTPVYQDQTYVTSTWLRMTNESSEVYTYDAPIKSLKANLFTQTGYQLFGLYGQMKRQIRDWIYVELIIDLLNIKNNVYAEIYRTSTVEENLPAPTLTNFTISYEISTGDFDIVDVDHVRFMPLSLDLTVNVYSPKTGLEVDRILPDGSVLRKVYNDYGIEIASVDEEGQVEQFKSLSRSGFIFPPPTSESDLGIQKIRREVVLVTEQGSYERFDEYSLRNIWKIDDVYNPNSWLVTTGMLEHVSLGTHSATLNSPDQYLDLEASALRFHVRFTSNTASLSVSLDGLANIVTYRGDGTLNIANDCKVLHSLPSAGELTINVFDDTLWLWFDGVLVFDRTFDRSCKPTGYSTKSLTPWKSVSISATGNCFVKNIVTLSKPLTSMEYLNAWGDRTQIVQLEDVNTVQVSETVFDEFGRDAIKVKATRIERDDSDSPVLIYYSDFVKNRNPNDKNSIFKVGTLDGIANSNNLEDDGFPYTRTIYHPDMLREAAADGLPGKDFSATHGTFQTRYSRKSDLPFLEVLFPTRDGFKQKATYEPNGNIKVMVHAKNGLEVAEYVKVQGFVNTLAIYEYTDDGKIAKILPPNYHKKMNTYSRTTPWSFGDDKLTEEEIFWQQKYGTHFKYDSTGQVSEKKSPDYKTKGMIYDEIGNLRYTYTINSSNETLSRDEQMAEDVVYMVHSGSNKPIEIGHFQEPMLVGDLIKFQNGTELPPKDAKIHQQIVYADTHSDPVTRGKVRMFLTYDDFHSEDPTRPGTQAPPHQELLKFNAVNHIVMKTSNAVFTDTFSNYRKHYKGGQMTEMVYPAGKFSRMGRSNETFTLVHNHNKLGKLHGIGTRTNPTAFANLQWNAAGQVSEEHVDPLGLLANAPSPTLYQYDSPGQLRKIQNSHLAQKMSFIDGGYGQKGHGSGILMSNIMTSEWSKISKMNDVQKSWFTIPEEDFKGDKDLFMCLQALKRIGVLDKDSSIPLRFLTKAIAEELPLACVGTTAARLMQLVAQYLPPTTNYGHQYSYGTQRELTKAKFFGDEEDPMLGPLQISTFLKSGIKTVATNEDAEKIWDILKQNGFIIVDNGVAEDVTAAIGKQGITNIFYYSEMRTDLQELDGTAEVFAQPIINVLHRFMQSDSEEFHSLEEFQDIFVNWHGYYDVPTAGLIISKAKSTAAKIHAMLISKNYTIKNLERILNPAYANALEEFKPDLLRITKLLTDHFAVQIGSSIHDYESFNIDTNGNQKLFYAGLNRHEMEYDETSNHITKLTILDELGKSENVTNFQYDNQGNMINAEHRGVKLIKYHPVINRPVFMELIDGRRILIRYDSQGERLIKRVFGKGNHLISETKYLRDENGRVLMDTFIKYDEERKVVKELETTYIYSPRGTIMCFIRNGLFYRVFTDHSGSPRLIALGDEVVAGYDYWPYGELMRSFGDEDVQLTYRFSNQEYDSETGLYNFHARMYDPTLGRFLQPDPKEQYFSPYIYGGNSPVSMVDPDGEFFFILFCVIGAVVGAFMAGAAANGSWNPAKWNWKSPSTWLAIIGGGIGGAMLPGALLQAGPWQILFGVVGSYLQAAKANGSFNPARWDWKSPNTYNAFIDGFSAGITMKNPKDLNIKSWKSIKAYAKNIGKTGQKMWKEIAVGVAFAFVKGGIENGFKFWEWDWDNPATYAGLLDGFNTGKGFAEKGGKMYKDMGKANKEKKSLKEKFKTMRGNAKTFFQDAFKDKKHPLWKTIGKAAFAYAATSIEHGWDLTKWNWLDKTTYESLLNGYKLPHEIKTMKDTFKERDWNANMTQIERIEKKLTYAKTVHSKVLQFTEKVGKIIDLCKYNQISFPHCKKKVGRVVMEFLAELNEESYMKDDFMDDFAEELGTIMRGIFAGGKIFPTDDSILSNLVDCFDTDTTFKSGSKESTVAECQINSQDGKVTRRNKELIKLLFNQSKLYQSKNAFIEVKPHADNTEYPQVLLKTFTEISNIDLDRGVSFMLGSFYNSLINGSNRKRRLDTNATFLQYERLTDIDMNMLHMSVLQNETLTVRSAIFSDQKSFENNRANLQQLLLSKSYHCQVKSSAATVTKLHSEAFVIVPGKEPKVYVMTPDLVLSNCAGNEDQFVDIPTHTSQLPQLFEDFLVSDITPAERLSKYDIFLQHLTAAFDNPTIKSIFPNPSFQGFSEGFLHGNVKSTYEVTLESITNVGGESILIMPKRSSTSQPTWYANPAIITGSQSTPPLFPLLHKAGLLTLTKEVMIGVVNEAEKTIDTHIGDLPSYGGFYKQISDSVTPESITEAIKYIYYNHYTGHERATNNSNNAHFVSNFLLGELVSHLGTSEGVQIHVFAPSTATDQVRLKYQRIFVISNVLTGEATILNLIESSKEMNGKFIYDASVSVDVPAIPNIDVDNIQMIVLKLNSNSVSGWSLEEAIASAETQEEVFFQNIEISANAGSIRKDDSFYVELEAPELSSLTKLSFDKENVESMFQKLKENRLRLLINQGADFESLVVGSVMGASLIVKPDIDGISVTLKNLLSDVFQPGNLTTMSILSVGKDGDVIANSEQVLLANLNAAVSNSDSVETMMSEGIEDIGNFQCSNNNRLTDVFKITKLPAVYDAKSTAETGERIMYEIDPETLANVTCSAEEGSTESSYMKYTEKLFTYSKEIFGSFFGYKSPAKIPTDTNMEGCHLGAWVNDKGYSTDGITCKTGKSSVAVFRNIDANDLVTISARGKPFNMVGDKYDKKTCKPVSWNGKPSVACDGEKTTMIYTPFYEKRIFDELDGNIMLARVFTHLGAKLWTFVRGSKQAKNTALHIVTEDMMDGWESSIKEIRTMAADWDIEEGEKRWVFYQLMECEQELSNIKNHKMNASPELIEELEERLGALKEDVTEHILYTMSEQLFGEHRQSYIDQSAGPTTYSSQNHAYHTPGHNGMSWSNFANANLQQ